MARSTRAELAAARERAFGGGKLRFVSDARPGIRRRRRGKHFSYVGPDGTPVRDPSVLDRIRVLAIPPAWTDVWICPAANGHLQATGRDAKGRKQYRYHPRYRAERDEVKYEHLRAFGQALPRIRRRVERDLSLPGLPREKVLAAVVALMDAAHLRVGNEEYTRENGSFGATTLRNRHARVSGSTVRLKFRGKSGKEHVVGLKDRRLARVVKRCQELPGQMLFEYLDEDGELRHVESGDVNDYLHSIAGREVTAKDFRTWAGTVLVAEALDMHGCSETITEAKRAVVAAIDDTAERLGNTRAVCRSAYVHPDVIHAYENGVTLSELTARPQRLAEGLRPVEQLVLSMLKQRGKRLRKAS